MDSGIRRGADIIKSIALGACGVLVGRAPLWGTAVGGEAGAKLAIDILVRETDRVLAQLGCTSVESLTRDCIVKRCPQVEAAI